MGPQMKAGLEVMKDGKVYSSQELREKGIDRRVIKRLRDGDFIQQIGRGRYCINEEYMDPPDWFNPKEVHEKDYLLDEFVTAVNHGGPQSIICLYSAAAWHDLSIDSNVPQIYVGLPWARGKPQGDDGMCRFIRWRHEDALELGVEKAASHRGYDIMVTSKARTIVDLFRYSPLNKIRETSSILINEESVTEAFGRYAASNEYSPSDLHRIAEVFGVGYQVGLLIKSHAKSLDEGGENIFKI